jgi:UDP-2,3-diacylglucosamine hydrolase
LDLWLLSDIHLKSNEERNSQILLRFLLSLKNKERPVTHLVLLGDIFDLWIGAHQVFIDRWAAHLAVIKDLVSGGNVKIIFVEGNHDVHLAPFWEKFLGVKVYTEPINIFINPYNIHIEHGDLINQLDKNYLRYRKLIRSVPLKFLGLNLPGFFWDKLGTFLSRKSGEHSRIFRSEEYIEKLRNVIREYSLKLVEKKDVPDYIFTGHFHVQDEYEINVRGKRTLSVNLGSWLGDSVQVYHLNEAGGKFVSLFSDQIQFNS